MGALYNDHNVYVLGAGFSAPAGMPLIAGFMYELRDAWQWLAGAGRLEEARAVEKVLQFRRDSAAAAYRVKVDLENIEELFSLASATREDYSAAIQVAVAATLDYCSRKSAPTTTFGADLSNGSLPATWKPQGTLVNATGNRGAQYIVPFYQFAICALLGRFSDSNAARRQTFVTFNYDMLLEEALQGIQVPVSYGFRSRSFNTDTSAHALGRSESDATELLKMHGSINWAYPGTQGSKMTVYGSYEEVKKHGLIPHLIPPTWDKSFESLGDVWLRALNAIGDATRIVVIGFSIPATDQHFKYLLAAGLRQNISLREIVFVTPDKDRLLARASDLFGDLGKRPAIRIVPYTLQRCLNPAFDSEFLQSIGRPIEVQLMNLSHSV